MATKSSMTNITNDAARRLGGRGLSGAVALITGGGSGIGQATAVALAGRGAQVLVVDVNGPAAEETVNSFGGGGEAFVCDVSDWDAMSSLASQVNERFGPLDVLVNNAGVGMTGRFAEVSVEEWRWIRSINLDGVIHACRAFGPAMVERGSGQVVNVASGLAYSPRATEPSYVTTKAAVLALSLCLRADWGGRGVGVSAICPGIIDTPIVHRTRYVGSQDDDRTRRRAARLFRRGHPPEAVARAVVDAVRRDRAVVPVGWEASLGWWWHRFAPLSAQVLVARGSYP
jgi:NAD(P)-dependent dehydrogenase (short-subunit alcohol dehydrogenase family)